MVKVHAYGPSMPVWALSGVQFGPCLGPVWGLFGACLGPIWKPLPSFGARDMRGRHVLPVGAWALESGRTPVSQPRRPATASVAFKVGHHLERIGERTILGRCLPGLGDLVVEASVVG
jgi:hypothetical protein